MITYIQINNFKSIKEARLSLSRVNILVGQNGAGKSNFVKFFHLTSSLLESRLNEYVGKSGGANRLLYLGSKTSRYLGGDFIFDNSYHYGINFKPNDLDRLILVSEIYRPFDELSIDSIVHYNYRNYEPLSFSEANLTQDKSALAIKIKESILPVRVYHFQDVSSDSPLKNTARILDAGYLRVDGINLAAFLYNLQQNERQSFNKIEATVRLVAPFFDRFDFFPNGDYIRLNWRQKGADMYLDASDFSDGTLRFIALATLLLQPKPPKTILIDEPELGLHPYAITILAGLMKSISSKSQIIASTQSVNLVNEFEAQDIIVVENQNNESTFRRLSEQELGDWLQEYTIGELWSKNVFGGNP